MVTGGGVRMRASAIDRAERGARIAQAGEERLARFESLRAVAALGVVVGHAWAIQHAFGANTVATPLGRLLGAGGAGVFVFFALSGYLLFRPLLRAALGEGARIDLVVYARNRALRILPLYYAVVVVLLVLGKGGGDPADWLRFATFTQNFFQDTAFQLDGPMWSVIVELQFYVLLPFLALALTRVSRGNLRTLALVLVGAGVALEAVRLWVSYRLYKSGVHGLLDIRMHDMRLFFSLPASAVFFVPGMLLAVVRVAWQRRGGVRLPGRLISSDAWALAALAAWLYVVEGGGWLGQLLVPVASLLTVGAVALPLRPGRFVALLDRRALAAVGVVSYSLYLWHYPLLESLGRHVGRTPAVLFALGVPAALAVAFASYWYVEERFLEMRRRWVRSPSAHPAPTVGSRAPAVAVPASRRP